MNIQPAPFHLTSEAERMMRHMLALPQPGMEPSLNWTEFLESSSDDEGYLGRYEGPMVFVGHWKKNERPRDSFFDVCGYPVSIVPGTLEHLEGKTIDFGEVKLLASGSSHSAFVFKVG